MKRILITGAGGAGIYPIWQILKKKYKIFLADIEISSIHHKIPENLKIKIPPGNNKEFKFKLKKIIKDKKINLIIPTVDEEIINISKDKYLSQLSYIPNSKFIAKTMDKFILTQELKKVKFRIPKTYLCCDKKIPFPKKYILKPRFGRGSKNVHIISKSNQINNYLKLFNYKCRDIIAQEYINGEEYTIFVGMDKNEKLEKIFPLKILKKKGITISGKSINEKKVIKFVKEFADKFKTKNSYNIQLIYSEGKIYPFEINPRISTTFFLTLNDGYNPFVKRKHTNKRLSIVNKRIELNRYWSNIITK